MADESAGRVLIVDDEELVSRGYARALRKAGFEVHTATSGQDALKQFDNGGFDTIISDILMPGMGGLDLIREIRNRDQEVPVIVVTGGPSIDTAIKAMERGALKYLIKPVDVVKLTDAVKRAMQLRRMAEMKRLALELMGKVEDRSVDRKELSATFDRALAGLYVHYQPIVRWSTQSVYGYEVLVRSRESGLPHPGALFDAAETLDRVVELGRAIRKVAPSAPDLPKGARLFVNLHPLDLSDEMLLERTAPLFSMVDRVILEITERSSLDAIPNVRDRVNQLRLAGYTIAVDDLGAGYAGLTSFAMLEPDVAKLDMSIVRDIDRLDTKRKLVESMAKLCNEMNIALVAEGVETVAERDTVVSLGCDLLQGYLLARPATVPPPVNYED